MNKLLNYYIPILSLLFTTVLMAKNTDQNFDYRRSSLHMILIESDDFPEKNAVLESWKNYPFPEKYNKHTMPFYSFNADSFKISDEELLSLGYLKDTLKDEIAIASAELTRTNLKYLNDNQTIAVILPSESDIYRIKIDKCLKEENLAQQCAASWFNRNDSTGFNMNLVQERGFYNATEMEAGIAMGQVRGLASLGDAGEELISNTFLTFTKLEFVENEPIARAFRDKALKATDIKLAGSPDLVIEMAKIPIYKAYDKAKEGYSLWSKSWLFKFEWNDSIANIFYNDLWSNPDAFDTTRLFSFTFVGEQYNQSLVTFSLTEQRTHNQIIDIALVRNVDNAFAKLQKKNDVFKPKVPVVSSDPIIAQIGMKEGLEGGERFEVLEMTMNKKTGYTEYKRVGSVTVNKKHVWDNRYNAGMEKMENTSETLGTEFKGPKDIYPGMLLKQIN